MMEEVMKRAAAELRAREKARDEVLSRARRARMLSKQAIMLIHNDDHVEAEAKLEEAKKLLDEVEAQLKEHVELGGFEAVYAAREEYAEAYILHELKMAAAFPRPEAVGVPLYTYLLGLADVVGELRRDALDSLRVGDLEAAEADLRLMEHVYLSLVSMEEVSLLLKGLRRKLDVARGVIERTRGELTAEIGRQRLSKSIEQLVDRLDQIQE